MKPLMAAAAVEASDEQLVAAARAGSDTAFEALFRRYRDRINAYVRGIVFDHGRAEDIVQDVFISAHRNLLASHREIAFRPWVYEIAKNASIDQVRRARRTSEVSIDSDDFSDRDEGRMSARADGTDAEVSIKRELDSLKMAFHELPEQQHEVLVMRELEGLSYDKISSRTGLSRSAVESVLFRARRRLKDEFDDISTGERCLGTQTALAKLVGSSIGIREERRMFGHLQDCAACRREAVAMGLDDVALRVATGRGRSALSRAASFLPLPAFLRRRWLDGLHSLGSAGSSGAEQGASLVAKAAAVVAAAALMGGGAAGVAHKTAGHDSAKAGSGPNIMRQQGSDGAASRSAGSGAVRPGQGARNNGGARSGTGGRQSLDRTGPGGGSSGSTGSKSDLGGLKGSLDQTLSQQDAGGRTGSLVNGLAGSAGGDLGSTVEQVTKGTQGTVQQVGSGATKTVQSVGGTVNKLPSTTVPDVQPTLDQVTSALPQAPVTDPAVKLPSTKLTP